MIEWAQGIALLNSTLLLQRDLLLHALHCR